MMEKTKRPQKFSWNIFPGVQRFFFGRNQEIHYIGGADVLPAPLAGEEESRMIGRLGSRMDQEAKETLIEHNLRLVVYIAKKFDNTGVGVEDLISIGTIGLIKAINTFNPEKNIKLATYASRCIENEILMFFRSAKKTAQDVSLNDPIDTDKDGNTLTLLDTIATDDHILEDIDLRMKVRQLYDAVKTRLSPREREIVLLRYGLTGQRPLVQREVAKKLNISRSYVSRLEKKALQKLRKAFDE